MDKASVKVLTSTIIFATSFISNIENFLCTGILSLTRYFPVYDRINIAACVKRETKTVFAALTLLENHYTALFWAFSLLYL